MGSSRLLLSRTILKSLVQPLTSFNSSRIITTTSIHNLQPHTRRTFSSVVPDYDSTASVAAALNLDTRVPATIITGFLGSGKVHFLTTAPTHFFAICLFYRFAFR